MNIPYDQFYAAELQNDVAVDGVTSATLNKTRTGSLVGGSYHVDAKGTDITGITFPVKVGKDVSLSEYTQVTDDNSVEITVTNKGNTSTTTYTGKDVLFESDSYAYYVLSETPAYYKEATLDQDGKLTFGKVQGDVQALDVTASLTTNTTYGDYQVEVEVDLDSDTVKSMGNVYGVILSTREGTDYGMRHLENVWRTTEIAWCTGFTTSVHNCPTSSEHYKAMMGQTINQITYITAGGIYTIDTELYVPVKFEGKLTVEAAAVTAGEAAVAAELPEDYQAVYAVTDAKGAAVSGMEIKDGKLTWTAALGGSYTLTVSDSKGKYAPLSASFVLTSDAMPAQAAEDNQSIVKAEGAADAKFNAFVSNITKVNVNGKDYAATGKGAVKVIKADGTIDFTTAPFKENAVDGKYVLTVTVAGYSQTLTVTVPETYYLYASLSYEEYWENEGVYAAGNTDSSDVKDSKGEYDKGGFDAVTRATANHGVHRGSFQQVAVMHVGDKDYYPLYWTSADEFVDAKDGNTYNRVTVADADELLGELPGLIAAAKALAPEAKTYTGTATTTPDEDGDFTAYTLTATVTVEDGKITAVTAQGGGDDNAKYLDWAITGRTKGGKDYLGVPAQLIGNTVTLPDGAQLDLGAVAKGYAGDRAAEILKDAGVTSALLNLGSSTIHAIGSKPDGSAWRIAIQDPNVTVETSTETYTGTAKVLPDEDEDFDPYDITLTVTVTVTKTTTVGESETTVVTEKTVTDIEVAADTNKKNLRYLTRALKEMKDRLLALGSADAVSGATCSSLGIQTAWTDAMGDVDLGSTTKTIPHDQGGAQ